MKETFEALVNKLIQEVETCLDNSHWEVKFGSGDLRKTIAEIKAFAPSSNDEPFKCPWCLKYHYDNDPCITKNEVELLKNKSKVRPTKKK